MDIRIIAFYLPQFYETPENNRWWGEGFTEWTAVKAATPLFDGQNQPRIPYNKNYYNLLDKMTMETQARLMKQYDVYGMCFYHYWFKNGRRILEKPAENLLQWDDINMPFCFSWANESWVRTWGGEVKNGVSWARKFEKEQIADSIQEAVLLEQSYGTTTDWEEHFYYLLPFFKDSRYINHNGKPIFLIYRPELIDCLTKMVEHWQQLAHKEGLSGIYFIGANSQLERHPALDAMYHHEPKNSFGFLPSLRKEGIRIYDYDVAWNYILSKNSKGTQKIFSTGFVDYDDSSRHGILGSAFQGVSPKKFEFYLTQLLKKSMQAGNEYVFLNAWNEWGEGMYLEPDMKYGTQFLQSVSNALSNYKTIDFTPPQKMTIDSEFMAYYYGEIQRQRSFWRILDKWLLLKEKSITLCEYFAYHDIKNVAVYGLGMLAHHLFAELKNTDVHIAYGIDKRKDKHTMDFPVFYPEDNLPEVDAIVVTVAYDFDTVKGVLAERINTKILSLEDIVMFSAQRIE